ncbi:MAG TPA: DUF748 domain-containing protein [Candidatus Acidoferrales bacterium]|nr:DUF748 domain-containing protein [Candidatus Acidoferrales bacterium]
MKLDVAELRSRALDFTRRPRTRKAAIWTVAVVLAVGVLGALIAPPLVRLKLASELSRALHRDVSIAQVRINPYAMSATVRGLVVREPKGGATAFAFDELYVNLQLSSLFRLAPVLKEIKLVKPHLNLVRNEDFTYNFSDLIEEFTKAPADPKSKPAGPPPRFSLNNIEIVDGRIDFDDRPEGVKHSVTSLSIGVPFISSLPSYVDIKVQPAFSALVNGGPVAINGETKPFADSRESTIQLNIDKLQIPKYAEYSPVELNFKVPSGEIDGKISASFRTTKDRHAVLVLSGNLGVKDLALREKDDRPIFSLAGFQVLLDSFEVFRNRADVKSIRIQSPELHVTREPNGAVNLAALVASKAEEKAAERKPPAEEGPAKAPDKEKAQTPFAYRIDEIVLEQGKLFFRDRAAARPFEKRLDDIRVVVKGLTTEANKKAQTEISFQADGQEQFDHSGSLQLAPLAGEGKVQLTGLQLKDLSPYYEGLLNANVRDGLLDLETRFAFEKKEEALEARLFELNTALRSLRVDLPGEAESLWRIPVFAVKDAEIDLGKKSVVIGAIESRDGQGFLDRAADGRITYARLMKRQGPEAPPKAQDKPARNNEWRVDAGRVRLDRFRLLFEDRATPDRARTVLSDVSVLAENFSNAKNSRAKATIRARINRSGALRLAGTAGIDPLALRFDVDARAVELVPFQPYLAERVNFIVTGGEIGTRGKLNVEAAENAPAKVLYEGTIELNDFASVERNAETDLLQWKSLVLGGLRFSMQPVQVQASDITLADFYARVIIGPDGKFNLQNLTVQKNEAPAEPAGGEPEPQAPAAAPSQPAQVAIGKIQLRQGNINFSDFFVKPNYSANLTQVQGFVAELKPEAPGDLQLQAKIDNAAPVDVSGKINPLGKELFLDIKANARDIELSPLTPYSAKYVGYGIEKGKLSLDVQYRVENRKLTAQNKIVLNQLTFGDRVESPTAIKAPVLLAVALLKDRNGVIDVNLPIGGSLDDPQFSVGGIVLRLIFNIITRAVTAPFALLASAFGGGEELSYVEFADGRADLDQTAEARLKTLATALQNRPALRLEIAGRADRVNDLEGLKRVMLERKVKAQKLKTLASQGAAPKSVDDVEVNGEEYARFLWLAYKQEPFPKERNLIGLVKELPAPQMESLILEHTQVTEEDLRDLANRRAQAVRDYLLTNGKVSAERLFLVTADLAPQQKDQGKASRVEFSLR